MNPKHRLLAFVCCFFLVHCSTLKPLLTGYETYEHPTLRFSIDYPKDWEVAENAAFGTQVQFLSNLPEMFRASANITINRAPQLTRDQIADLSIEHLSVLLRGYQVQTKAIGNLGPFEAVDLRATYIGSEGPRIMRTVISTIDSMQYVFTFSCQKSSEQTYSKIVNKMIDSFSRSHTVPKDDNA